MGTTAEWRNDFHFEDAPHEDFQVSESEKDIVRKIHRQISSIWEEKK